MNPVECLTHPVTDKALSSTFCISQLYLPPNAPLSPVNHLPSVQLRTYMASCTDRQSPFRTCLSSISHFCFTHRTMIPCSIWTKGIHARGPPVFRPNPCRCLATHRFLLRLLTTNSLVRLQCRRQTGERDRRQLWLYEDGGVANCTQSYVDLGMSTMTRVPPVTVGVPTCA